MALTQISTGGIKDDAVTDAKLPANSVGNSEMKDDAVGVAELSASGTAGNTTFLRGDNTWSTPADTNTQLSTEQVQDIVGAMFTGNTETNITATYEDGDGTIDLVATAGETNRMPLAGGTFTGDVTFDNQSTGGRDIIWDESDDALEFLDNTKATFGNDADLKIYHNGTDNYIMPSNGKLIINNGSETLAQFISDGAVELYHNGVKKLNTDSGGIEVVGAVMPSGNISMVDSAFLKLGASDDLKLHHNGTDNVIEGSQHLIVKTTDAAKKIYLQSDTGIDISDVGVNEYQAKFINDGAVELYHDGVKTFNTIGTGIQVRGGEGSNCELFMYADEGDDNSDLWKFVAFHTPTGTLDLYNKTSGSWEKNISCVGDGTVELYHDNAKKLWTRSDGIEVTGKGVFSNHIYLPDDVKLILGNEPDLEIYHTGSHGYIKNDTGKLFLQAKDGEHSIECEPDEGVKLYYDNVKKLETLSGGIAIDGWLRVGGTAAANELDDYEEGNWTPTMPNSGSASFAAVNYAYYTKIGREVFWYLSVSYQNSSSNYAIPDNSTTFQIGGLPFNASGYGTGDVTYNDGSDLTESNSISTLVWTGNNRIYFHFLSTDTTAPTNNWARSKWSYKTIIYGGHYRV